MGITIAAILLSLFFWRLFIEVRQEMKQQAQPPEAVKEDPPPIINLQTNHYHLTQNNYTIKEKEDKSE